MRSSLPKNEAEARTKFTRTPPPSPQQRIQLNQQPGLILAPPRTVAPDLLDDGHEGLVLLHGEIRNALGRTDGHEDVLVEDLVHALSSDGLVAASVGGLAHDLCICV